MKDCGVGGLLPLTRLVVGGLVGALLAAMGCVGAFFGGLLGELAVFFGGILGAGAVFFGGADGEGTEVTVVSTGFGLAAVGGAPTGAADGGKATVSGVSIELEDDVENGILLHLKSTFPPTRTPTTNMKTANTILQTHVRERKRSCSG